MVLSIIYLGQWWCELEEDRLSAEQKKERSVTLLSTEHANVLLIMQQSVKIFLFPSSLI